MKSLCRAAERRPIGSDTLRDGLARLSGVSEPSGEAPSLVIGGLRVPTHCPANQQSGAAAAEDIGPILLVAFGDLWPL